MLYGDLCFKIYIGTTNNAQFLSDRTGNRRFYSLFAICFIDTMDRDMLFRHLEQRYTSKRDMISRVPLGVQPDALWQELLNQRRSKSTVLPLYSYKGTPYWYVTTDKLIAASEKIVEALYENDADYDPYAEPPTVSTLEEIGSSRKVVGWTSAHAMFRCVTGATIAFATVLFTAKPCRVM